MRPPALCWHLLPLCIGIIIPLVGSAPTDARFKEALTKVAAVRVVLQPKVRASIERIKDKHPGCTLAACSATGSMTPTFDENYIVVLEDCRFCDLQRGDIILTRWGDSALSAAIMHRVLDCVGLGNLQTKGDALQRPDTIHTTSFNYLGKRVVAAVHRQTGAIRWLGPDAPVQGMPSRILARR